MQMSLRLKVLCLLIILVLIAGFFLKPYYDFVKKITGTSPLKIALLEGKYKKTQGKINVILLGKGGARHDGPNLTDSILAASYDINLKRATLISVPRDIWSDTLKDRINSAYAYGETKKKGGGMTLAKAEVGAIIGLPIHYAFVVDFEKFTELIDYVGGIEVYVERSFDDFKFPIPGLENELCSGNPEYQCRYEHISFKKGWRHMNGDTALKFVRSRNAEGIEGTDFARNARQQKVVNALIEKIAARIKKLNVKNLEAMYNIIDRAVERDITNEEAAFVGKKLIMAGHITKVNVPLTEDWFSTPQRSKKYEGKFVFIPKNGSFETIHKFISCAAETGEPEKCKNQIMNENRISPDAIIKIRKVKLSSPD